ncbi:MAG: fatty acyl-AMP ligase, partial [Rhodospirillales bacterium]|nr:fatty acyl-AMP ligase [Rhodospirillales bacterium]
MMMVPTLAKLLHDRAKSCAHNPCYTFLPNGESEGETWSFARVEREARKWVPILRREAPAGARALLLFPPGLEFLAAFWGCMDAGIVAVPAGYPRGRRSLERAAAIAVDCQPDVVLTDADNLEAIKEFSRRDTLRHVQVLDGSQQISDDEILASSSVEPDSIALIQYTSGTTSTPKGVVLRHRHLVANQVMIAHAMKHDDSSTFVSWLPHFHDMGLIGNLIHPFYLGTRCIFMPPAAFLQRPARWLQAIARYRAHTSGAPNFAYDLCARQISANDKAGLDLSSWRVAFNGSEPVQSATLRRFRDEFSNCGFQAGSFYPTYGLSEATLMVSGGMPEEAVYEEAAIRTARSGRALVKCGRSVPDTEIRIVSPQTRRICPDGAVGEVWVHGPSIADGYWSRVEETSTIFHARIDQSEDRRYLRTGDLGFLRDGELFITGRLKDLVIVRGLKYQPHEIESLASASHPMASTGSAAAFQLEDRSVQTLAVV